MLLQRPVSQRLYDCPQCGAPVPFGSSIAVFAVCAHCQSMVVLRGASVERMGEMAALPPPLTARRGAEGVWAKGAPPGWATSQAAPSPTTLGPDWREVDKTPWLPPGSSA